MRETIKNKQKKQIGYLLQYEREIQSIGQETIARQMDVGQESVSRIEAGTRRIDILELIDYAHVLGFSITEMAWKIETYLSALSLLPLPHMNVLNKKIRVKVTCRENVFLASVNDIVPETFEFTADNFDELQIEIEESFDSYFKGMAANGVKVPRWLLKKKYEFEYNFLDAKSLLKAYSPYISLTSISRVSGINRDQLSQYANGLKKARPNQLRRIADAIHKIGKELTAVVV